MSFGSSVSSGEFQFDNMDNFEDFDGMFLITGQGSGQNEYAKLDCQSYFHKFDLYDSNNNLKHENYISFGECEYLYKNFKSCLNKQGSKCVNSDDIFDQNCDC